MKVKPIIEICRIRKNLNLTCFGCQYRGEACEAMKTLLRTARPGDASALEVTGGKINVSKR
jgi:hypothetical protein